MDTPRSSNSIRKLTTIFAADVAEYSRHVSENEDFALDQLHALRNIMDAIIADHGGRIANTAGDSVIAEFESPTECVRAAVEIQHQHKLHNESVPRDQRLLYRIGINIGDVTQQDDGDLLGNGVNVAARLEAIAQPGGICVSENVYSQISGTIDLNLSKIGEHFVKNIDKPIQVYAVGDNISPLAHRATRIISNTARRPATMLVVLLVAGAAFLTGIWSIISTPEITEVDANYIENLNKKSKQEILDSFDLVTEGSFDGSHYYVIRTWYRDFDELNEIAESLGGHLVAINSEEENKFVYALSVKESGHWHYGEEFDQYFGPLIGLVQAEGAQEPDGGWRWINGDPLQYTNWKINGPENANGHQSIAILWGRGQPSSSWDDVYRPQWSIIVEIGSHASE